MPAATTLADRCRLYQRRRWAGTAWSHSGTSQASCPAAQTGCRCTAHPRQHGVAFEQLLQQAQAGAAGGHRELRQGDGSAGKVEGWRQEGGSCPREAKLAEAAGRRSCSTRHDCALLLLRCCAVLLEHDRLPSSTPACKCNAQRTCGYSGSTTRRVMPSRFTSSIASSAAAQGGEHSTAHALNRLGCWI